MPRPEYGGSASAAAGTHTAVIYGAIPVGVRGLREIAEMNKIDVVGVAGDHAELLRLLGQQDPDICLLEISDDDDVDLDLIRRVHDKSRKMEVIAIGERDDPADITAALTAGADVYILQNSHPDDVALALRHAFGQPFHVAYGAFPTPSRQAVAAGKAAGEEDEILLTRREQEILRLASEGHSNSAIASMLWVTEQTVKFHLSNLYRKLKVANRTEAAQWARDSGLVAPVAVGV